jgi:hypothetical protein
MGNLFRMTVLAASLIVLTGCGARQGQSDPTGEQSHSSPARTAIPPQVYMPGNMASGVLLYRPECDFPPEDCVLPVTGSQEIGYSLYHINWSTWSDNGAAGSGTAAILASGHEYLVPATVTLSRPVKRCAQYYWTEAVIKYKPSIALASARKITSVEERFSWKSVIGEPSYCVTS